MTRPSARNAPVSRARSGSVWIWIALLAVTATAYAPAWHGGLLWDDDAHVTAEALRSWGGLVRIWKDPSATQQYYPVSSSAFWVMAQLWGSGTLGYHLVNIALHATSAFLVVVILRKLGVAAALVAGVMFALHPVQVESVAWISELKNTLSGVFYLGALLVYLAFDQSRRRASWLLALVLFALALGSKTVTATLPAAVLVILWWQRGRIDVRRDVVPLVPFFVLGAIAGLSTAWLEVSLVGARGDEFALSLVARVLIAGRAAWFYAWKLVWPFGLMFNYPRWSIDAAVWWQYLFPVALLVAVAVLIRTSAVNRGPAAAALFFLVTLGPALGFVNVFPFRYSFVADHFQYLAGLGVMVAAASGLLLLARRLRPDMSPVAVAVLIALPLGAMTYAQSREYASAEVQYRATIEKNPWSSLARNNLAQLLLDGPESGWAEGLTQATTVLSFKPDDPVARNLYGLALQKAGRFEQSIPEFREAIRLRPSSWQAHYNLGLSLYSAGRPLEAVAPYEASLAIHPQNGPGWNNYGTALLRLRREAEARAAFENAARLLPGSPLVLTNLSAALEATGDITAALAAVDRALASTPAAQSAPLHNRAGLLSLRLGRRSVAVGHFEAALQVSPGFAEARANLERARK